MQSSRKNPRGVNSQTTSFTEYQTLSLTMWRPSGRVAERKSILYVLLYSFQPLEINDLYKYSDMLAPFLNTVGRFKDWEYLSNLKLTDLIDFCYRPESWTLKVLLHFSLFVNPFLMKTW